MGSIFLDMAMSLDGFICGPNGEDAGLHDWYFATPGAAVEVVDELLHTIGAIVMGKQAFGDAPDGFDTPYKVPHFIVTHASLPTISRDGATFTFVTEGIEGALVQAQTAAGGKDVCVAGGATIAQQCINAGLLDELQIHLVPILVGGGKRLFDGLSDTPIKLERTRVIESRYATHLRFRVVTS